MENVKLIPPDEALAIILRSLPEMGSESVPIERSRGRVLSEEIIANEHIPRFANASMDGYALLDRSTASTASGKPCTLKVAGESSAGSPFGEEWDATRECVRIMTGAVVPDGANAVVELELVTEHDGQLVIHSPVPRGRNIRLPGEDMRRGECVISPGVVLEPEHIGVMASLGFREVGVSLRPSVTVITTGSELVDPASVPAPGEVRNSSMYMISSYVEEAGGSLATVLAVGDEKEELHRALKAAWESDVVITTGGVSVGKYDLMLDALTTLDVDVSISGVNIKPGKPFAFGVAPNGTPVFCLPGNPVSSAVTFWKFVRPAFDRMMGRKVRSMTHCKARLEEEIEKRDTKVHYLRGVFSVGDDFPTVRQTGNQSSGALSSMTKANCFIVLPPEKRTFVRGELVEIHLI